MTFYLVEYFATKRIIKILYSGPVPEPNQSLVVQNIAPILGKSSFWIINLYENFLILKIFIFRTSSRAESIHGSPKSFTDSGPKKPQIKDSVNIPNYDQIIQLNRRLWNELEVESKQGLVYYFWFFEETRAHL